MQYLLAVFFGCGLIGLAVYFARQDGQRAERLAALKREIKERENVRTIKNKVDSLPIDIIYQRLQKRGRN